jgi:ATP phosphoribosyltransferase
MTQSPSTIRLALPSKGQLHDGAMELLKTAGYKVKRLSDRQYEAAVSGYPRFHVVFMRPTDIAIQTQEGRCQLGITGLDVFQEHAADSPNAIVILPDLGYGACRLSVAVPESWIDVSHIHDLVDLTTEYKSAGRGFRVSTKYPALVRRFFRQHGIFHYQLIHSEGALELHPSLGIADIIVDLTSSGATLKDNRLREIDGGVVLESAACLIGHGEQLAALAGEGGSGPLARFLDAIDGVRGAEQMLHIEVVGRSSGDHNPPHAALDTLRSSGAREPAHTAVTLENGEPGWQITALAPAAALANCRRSLFASGARRVTAVPTRLAFDHVSQSTFERLHQLLAQSQLRNA